jgi:glutathione S-transferase
VLRGQCRGAIRFSSSFRQGAIEVRPEGSVQRLLQGEQAQPIGARQHHTRQVHLAGPASDPSDGVGRIDTASAPPRPETATGTGALLARKAYLMKLYQFTLSPNAKRARVIAREVGESVEVVEVDFTKGEHKGPEFLAKNPNGKVPVVEDGSVTLWESPAILVYYASKYPEKGLVGTSAAARAETAKWMFWNASHLEPGIFEIAFEKLVKPFMGQPSDEAKIKEGQEVVGQYMPILNAHLEGRDWLAGNAYGIADICLGTTIEFGVAQCACELGRCGAIAAWLRRVQGRDAWKQAS